MKLSKFLPHWDLDASNILLLYLLGHLMDSKEVFVFPFADIPSVSCKSNQDFLVSSLEQVELIEIGLLE